MRAPAIPVTALLALGLSATATTQTPAFRGGSVLVADDSSSSPQLYLVEDNGNTTPVPVSVPLTRLAGVAGTRLGEVVLADWTSGAVVLVPPIGNARTLATVPGGLRVAEDIDGSFLVTSFRTNSVVRVTRAGQTSTVFALAGRSRPYDVVVDEKGDYIFCDDIGGGTTAKGVHRVDRTTKQITPLYTGTGLPLAHGLAFFRDGDLAVMDGVRDEIYRLDRQGNLSVFVSQATLGNNPESIVESGDGGFVLALEHALLGRAIVRVDSAGAVTPMTTIGPFTNLEQVAVVPQLTGPTDLPTGPGAVHDFALDLPAQATAPYWVGLSASLFPGVALPNDPRALSINPDGLFVAALTGAAPAVFVRFVGVTDPSGRANPRLDLTVFAPGALAGFAVFAQAFTFDAQAPNGIGAITNPLRIDF